jgi:hypothetical protein
MRYTGNVAGLRELVGAINSRFRCANKLGTYVVSDRGLEECGVSANLLGALNNT